jgi:hypothetical protein
MGSGLLSSVSLRNVLIPRPHRTAVVSADLQAFVRESKNEGLTPTGPDNILRAMQPIAKPAPGTER